MIARCTTSLCPNHKSKFREWSGQLALYLKKKKGVRRGCGMKSGPVGKGSKTIHYPNDIFK